jgi:hypothetical protein
VLSCFKTIRDWFRSFGFCIGGLHRITSATMCAISSPPPHSISEVANCSASVTAPFLKWAGGKRWLVSRFPHLLPNAFSKYFEPFLGSGAVFFWLKPKRGGIISDVNSDLINAYKEVRSHPDKLLQHLRAHQRDHDDNHYYLTREKIPHTDAGRAARLLERSFKRAAISQQTYW